MDLNIKGLDDNVGRRLREQAEAAGLSVQQYLRTELTRIASRLSPTEFSRGRRPMNRDAFLAIRRRLRELDNSERRLRRGRHARRVEGVAPPNVEFLALDWSAVTVGRFLAAHYEGRVHKIRVEIGLVLSTIREWFPVRPIVADVLARAGLGAIDTLDSWSALVLSEHLELPLFTASNEVASSRIHILRPW